MPKSLAVFLSGVALVFAASTALAGEQVLEFKLVTKPIDYKITEAANVEGQVVGSGKMFGVAFFKDGRTAVKDFVASADLLKGSGPIYGYSTYTFEDGSSITARYAGAVKEGRTKGEYTILSGTGAYANATGMGSFESVPTAFKGAVFLTGNSSCKHARSIALRTGLIRAVLNAGARFRRMQDCGQMYGLSMGEECPNEISY